MTINLTLYALIPLKTLLKLDIYNWVELSLILRLI